jgi:hypothetical protein
MEDHHLSNITKSNFFVYVWQVFFKLHFFLRKKEEEKGPLSVAFSMIKTK